MARYDNIYEFESDLAGEGLAVGIVMSRFNQDIGEGLLAACTAELKRLGVADSDIEIATVAGALEIPLVLQSMAQSDRYDALVALGAVIRGDGAIGHGRHYCRDRRLLSNRGRRCQCRRLFGSHQDD